MAVRERLGQEARPQREAALREQFQPAGQGADAAAENARCRALQQTFGAGQQQSQDPKAAEAERTALLRAAFGQEQAAKREGGRTARREALRAEFSKEKAGARKTPEQIRHALEERSKPASRRRQGPGQGPRQGWRARHRSVNEARTAVGWTTAPHRR